MGVLYHHAKFGQNGVEMYKEQTNSQSPLYKVRQSFLYFYAKLYYSVKALNSYTSYPIYSSPTVHTIIHRSVILHFRWSDDANLSHRNHQLLSYAPSIPP
jgi:hypothetical protein